jgi:hypothetical protein
MNAESLSPIERSTLAAFECVIEKGLASFMEVGVALMRIRDDRLYRETHDTFEAYCSERWQISRPRAYQLIEAAEVGRVVSTNVDKSPANEAQIRPLTRLEDPQEQRAAWKEAVQTAPEGRMTAAHVEQVVRRRCAKSKKAGKGAAAGTHPGETAIEESRNRIGLIDHRAKQCHGTRDYDYYRAELDELRRAGTGPTQWDKLDQQLKRFANYFDQLVAERRENLESRTAEAMVIELWQAVQAYRKSVSRLGVERATEGATA